MARGLSTDDIMAIALEQAGLTEVPPDSQVYVPGQNLRRLLAGIDIGVAELLLARELGCDGVLAHHPDPATQNFPAILDRHAEQMVAAGVPAEVAAAAVAQLKAGRFWRSHSANYDHAPSVARRLGLAFLAIHNPPDEVGRRRMAAAVEAAVAAKGDGATVADVCAGLMALPEFRRAPTRPEVAVGSADAPCGRVAVAHGAGTNGGYPVARAYWDHGVSTVVYIHCAWEAIERLRREGGGNLVVAGHIASDLVGLNPLLEAIEARGVEVVRISGLGG